MFSVARGSLADLDETAFRRLVDEGEHLYVERKRQEPRAGFGPTVASFANMLGGWLLIGVADKVDGDASPVCGWAPWPGEPQQAMTQAMRKAVDPLPAFVAKSLNIDGKTVWAVRVFPSDATPHIVRGTGAVYVRTMDGKEPVRDASALLRLAERGREAEAAALKRIASPNMMPLLNEVNHGTRWEPRHFIEQDEDEEPVRAFALRAIPVAPGPEFEERVLSMDGHNGSGGHAEALRDGFVQMPQRSQHVRSDPRRRGYVFVGSAFGHGLQRHVVKWSTDAGGGIGARIEAQTGGNSFMFDQVQKEYFAPMLTAVVSDLEEKEAYGRCLLSMVVSNVAGVGFYLDGPGSIRESQIEMGGSIVIPAEPDEIAAQTTLWAAEMARAAGHQHF